MATATRPRAGSLSEERPNAVPDVSPLPAAPPGDMLYEVVDGQIVEKSMGSREADLAFLIGLELELAARRAGLGRAYVEMLFSLDRDRKLKRRPDAAFVSAAKWPAGRRAPMAEAWEMVPDLAVEVVSESNTANEVVVKLADYVRAGTRLVWIVFPIVRQVYVYSSPTDVTILTPPAELDGGTLVPGFKLPLARLFDDEPAQGA